MKQCIETMNEKKNKKIRRNQPITQKMNKKNLKINRTKHKRKQEK